MERESDFYDFGDIKTRRPSSTDGAAHARWFIQDVIKPFLPVLEKWLAEAHEHGRKHGREDALKEERDKA
jgi:hypothetical protein